MDLAIDEGRASVLERLHLRVNDTGVFTLMKNISNIEEISETKKRQAGKRVEPSRIRRRPEKREKLKEEKKEESAKETNRKKEGTR